MWRRTRRRGVAPRRAPARRSRSRRRRTVRRVPGGPPSPPVPLPLPQPSPVPAGLATVLFQAAERPRVKEEHAGTAPKEVTKLLGEAWKALGAEDKKKWEAEVRAAAPRAALAAARRRLCRPAPPRRLSAPPRALSAVHHSCPPSYLDGAAAALQALKDKQRYADECAAAGIELEAPGADKGKEEELKQELTAAQEQQKALEAAATAIKQPRAHKDAVACYKKAKRIEVATANPDMDVAQVVELMEARRAVRTPLPRDRAATAAAVVTLPPPRLCSGHLRQAEQGG